MPRAPRFVPPNSLVEVTTRTSAGLLLLRPCPELNERILGILGRALVLYPLSLHAFVFMSNHWHALISTPDAARLSAFLCYVNGNIAKAAQEVHGWTGLVWGRRAEIIPVVDDAAAEQRLRYILSHGVKEGLVSNPCDWPGVTSARALETCELLTGVWVSRRSKTSTAIRYDIALSPLPAWRERSPHAYRSMLRTTITSVKRDAHPAPVGIARILSQHPIDGAPVLERRAAPKVHATSAETKRAFLAARATFVAVYRAAVRKLAITGNVLTAHFPPGAFAPRMWAPSAIAPGPRLLLAS